MAEADTTASFASASIARQLERLAYQVGVTSHSPGTENIHDLRVAVRRFVQAMMTFREGLPGREVKRIRRKLKLMMDHAGAVRDRDVTLRILAKCPVPGAEAVRERLAEERKAELPALAAAMRRWSARRSSSKWRTALLPVNGHIVSPGRQLTKLTRKFLVHGEEAAQPKTSADALHAFRIEGKKLRYTLELLSPVSGAAAQEWLEKLKPLQSALGDVHDAEMARAIADRLDATSEVASWLKKRQRKKTRDFRRQWAENFGDSAENRRLVAGLRHTPRKPMGRSMTARVAAVRHA
jgi:CHAD domain-containing protein